MHIALDEARAAAARGEIPVGAVVIDANGQVVAQAGNRTRELSDPSAHAEILVIREACLRLGQERLADHDLYVTLEPCSMCAGLIAAARLRRLYYGATDEKSGGVGQGPHAFSRKYMRKDCQLDGLGSWRCAIRWIECGILVFVVHFAQRQSV